MTLSSSWKNYSLFTVSSIEVSQNCPTHAPVLDNGKAMALSLSLENTHFRRLELNKVKNNLSKISAQALANGVHNSKVVVFDVQHQRFSIVRCLQVPHERICFQDGTTDNEAIHFGLSLVMAGSGSLEMDPFRFTILVMKETTLL
jgi:hypothetical protein